MNRTLRLRRETLTELSSDELGSVVAAFPTSPIRVCLVDIAVLVGAASDASLCPSCIWCTVEPDAVDRS
ncbi:MAG TPA: hypothetical protein VF519_03780 [Mycobacteriales bacterium]|jgi:hypothetical protein